MIATQRIALTTALCLLAGVSQATAGLYTIGTANYEDTEYNLIYEPAQGLVWLDYTRPAEIAGTTQTWQDQKAWAAGLSFTGAQITLNPGYTTDIDWSTGWRLPQMDNPLAFEVYAGSEMSRLYYDTLGNTSGGGSTKQIDPFKNLDTVRYWLDDAYFGSVSDTYAWVFHFGTGYYSGTPMSNVSGGDSQNVHAIAVHEGTVSVVPVPGAAMLGLIGMATAGWFKRRRAL